MISILVPLYNGIEFLEECIDSVINQTFKDWECIIGINGHDYKSPIEEQANIISQKDKYNRIIVKWYSTIGKENTLNKMVQDTKYNFISILDADDKWFPEKLEKQVPYLNKYDVIGTGCKYFGDLNVIPNIPYYDFTKSHNFFEYNPIINSSVIIRKEDAFWENKFKGLDDYHLWFHLKYFKNKTFFNIPIILVFHRVYNSSAFNSSGVQDIDSLKNYWKFKVIE